MNAILILNIIFPTVYMLLLYSNQTNIYALLLIIFFALNIISQVVFFTITKPAKISFKFLFITTGKLISFILLPVSKLPTIIRIALYANIIILNLYHSSLAPNESFYKELTANELEASKETYRSLFVVGFCTAALVVDNLFGSIIFLLLVLKMLEKDKIKPHFLIEAGVSLALVILIKVKIIPTNLHLPIVVTYFAASTIVNYCFSKKRNK